MAGIGAPIGNQYALGNKGGGRKRMFIEAETRRKFIEMLEKEEDINVLKEKLRKGKWSIMDNLRMTALDDQDSQKVAAMDKILKRAYPEPKTDEDKGNGTTIINVVVFGGEDPLSKQIVRTTNADTPQLDTGTTSTEGSEQQGEV